MEVRAELIPNYLRHTDPDSLRVLCSNLNSRTGKFHNYTIVYDGKFWYAWYYSEAFDLIAKASKKEANK